MTNNFVQLQNEREAKLPLDLEQFVVGRAKGMQTAGNVANHFLATAFQVAGRLLSGEQRPDPKGPGSHISDEEDVPYWRIPPQSGR